MGKKIKRMNNPFISIIVPVYNVENYLCPCLDSILSQTFIDWECILVDDGSKDNSGTICDEYAHNDNRFKVFHKKNGGVSSARNLGLAEANGNYICFLDSDDRMKSDLLKTCIEKIGDSDVLIFGFERFGRRTDKMILKDSKVSGKEECKSYLYELKENSETSDFFCFPWNKLYKRDLLVYHNVQFPTDISLREDEIFAYRYLPYIKSLVTISDILVEYNDEPSGLSAKKLDPLKSIALANHLIEQTKCDNSNRSKNILFFRAMVYMEDALINTASFTKKRDIAGMMIDWYNDRVFMIDDVVCGGKYRKNLYQALKFNSVALIFLLAIMKWLSRLYRIHIKRDEYLKQSGTNA